MDRRDTSGHRNPNRTGDVGLLGGEWQHKVTGIVLESPVGTPSYESKVAGLTQSIAVRIGSVRRAPLTSQSGPSLLTLTTRSGRMADRRKSDRRASDQRNEIVPKLRRHASRPSASGTKQMIAARKRRKAAPKPNCSESPTNRPAVRQKSCGPSPSNCGRNLKHYAARPRGPEPSPNKRGKQRTCPPTSRSLYECCRRILKVCGRRAAVSERSEGSFPRQPQSRTARGLDSRERALDATKRRGGVSHSTLRRLVDKPAHWPPSPPETTSKRYTAGSS